MHHSSLKSLFALLLSVSLISACTLKNQRNTDENTSASPSNHGQAGVKDDVSKKNILQIALASPDHKTLATAIEAAEIQNVLVNAGPLTVFAPHDAAFSELPEKTVNDLLKPENKQKLARILTSHASPANLKMSQLKDGMQIYLATGQYVSVEVRDGETYVNGAKVLGTVDASNGWVHVVDKVFLFPEG